MTLSFLSESCSSRVVFLRGGYSVPGGLCTTRTLPTLHPSRISAALCRPAGWDLRMPRAGRVATGGSSFAGDGREHWKEFYRRKAGPAARGRRATRSPPNNAWKSPLSPRCGDQSGVGDHVPRGMQGREEWIRAAGAGARGESMVFHRGGMSDGAVMPRPPGTPVAPSPLPALAVAPLGQHLGVHPG